MGFNQAQEQAITHQDGPCMVLAGPGSGKTLTITKRVTQLITQGKVDPGKILVITFTKAAATEMRMRYLREAGVHQTPVTFGTFHGVFYGILKWAYRMDGANILAEEKKYQLLREIAGHMQLEISDEKDFLQDISADISRVKNNRIPVEEIIPAQCSQAEFAELYQHYEEQKKKLRKIDFEDMLILCYQLFTERPDCLKQWQERFTYILIDEFQDINRVQYDIIGMLARPRNNLFIVGDDDQSIYRFRGAKPEIMLGFEQDYPEAKKIVLNINYRSTKAIVYGAERVIKKNSRRYEKNVITLNEQGADILVQETKDPIEESQYLMGQVREAVKSGSCYEEMAVLYRTGTEARAVVETFMEYGVPFQMKEHLPNLYEHFIAKDLKTYMRMALGGRMRSDFLAVMNRPKRYIERNAIQKTEVTFEELLNYYCDKEWMQDRIHQWELDLRVMRSMTPYASIQYIRKRIGYDEFLKEYADYRRLNEDELFQVLHEIEESAKAYQSAEEWFDHIEEYGGLLKKMQAERKEEGVILMTMHAAKGLEYDRVFVIGANEGVVPYKKAVLEDDIEEERRMFYVAMTRSKKYLTITYTKERNGKEMSPSRFVSELLSV